MSGPATPVATLAVLTDLHVRRDGLLLERVDPAQRLRDALALLSASGTDVDALLLCGDVADDGDPAAYQLVDGLVGPAARRLGAAVVALPGNHDDPVALPAPVDRSVPVAGGALRVVVLDTTRAGRDTGHLDAEQLTWLTEELAREPGVPVVLAVHHTPLPTHDPFLAGLALDADDRQALGAVLAQAADVRLVVCGHTHTTAVGTLGGVPVVSAPPLSYAADALSPAGRLRTYDEGGLLRVDLHAGGAVVATPVGLPTTRAVLSDRPLSEHLGRLAELRAEGRA